MAGVAAGLPVGQGPRAPGAFAARRRAWIIAPNLRRPLLSFCRFRMKLRLLALLALCLCLPLSTPGQTATLHSDQHAQAERAALGATDPMAPVYIVTSQATFDAGLKTLSTRASPARDAAGRSLVVAQLRAHQLGEVSRMVHERERRCGGYFAFATRDQALGFGAAGRTAQAMRA